MLGDTRVVAVYNVYDDDDDGTEDAGADLEKQTGSEPEVERGLAEARGLAAEHGFRYAGVLTDHTYSFDGGASLAIDRLRGKDRVVADAVARALGVERVVVVPASPLSVVDEDEMFRPVTKYYDEYEVLGTVRSPPPWSASRARCT